MPQYSVKVTYDMNFSRGSETIHFVAANDEAAKEHLKKIEGTDPSLIKRRLIPQRSTLARVVK